MKVTRKNIEKGLLFAIIIALVIYYLLMAQNEQKIFTDQGEVMGIIVNYSVIFPDSHYLEYEYEVDNKKFHKRVSINFQIDNCFETRNCIGQMYPVVFQKSNPKNSIMRFNKKK